MNNCYPINSGNRDSKIGIELLDRNNVSRKDVSSAGLLLENKFLETEPSNLVIALRGFIYGVLFVKRAIAIYRRYFIHTCKHT